MREISFRSQAGFFVLVPYAAMVKFYMGQAVPVIRGIFGGNTT